MNRVGSKEEERGERHLMAWEKRRIVRESKEDREGRKGDNDK